MQKIDYKSILTELLKTYGLNVTEIAAKLGRTTRTVRRWVREETRPSPAEQKLLQQMHNGYKARE